MDLTLRIPKEIDMALKIPGKEKENIFGIEALLENNVIEVQEARDGSLIRALRRNLDYGESEVIAPALEIEADLVILDEKDARDVAEMYSLKKTGFLGILIKAKERGFIVSVKKYLDKVIEAGFRIDKKLYESIIESINR